MSMINCGYILQVVKGVLAPPLAAAGTRYPIIWCGRTAVQFSFAASPLHNPECKFIQWILSSVSIKQLSGFASLHSVFSEYSTFSILYWRSLRANFRHPREIHSTLKFKEVTFTHIGTKLFSNSGHLLCNFYSKVRTAIN